MDVLGTAIDISFVLVMLGVAFAFVRLVIGTEEACRTGIVALDMMTVLIVSFCGLYKPSGPRIRRSWTWPSCSRWSGFPLRRWRWLVTSSVGGAVRLQDETSRGEKHRRGAEGPSDG